MTTERVAGMPSDFPYVVSNELPRIKVSLEGYVTHSPGIHDQ